MKLYSKMFFLLIGVIILPLIIGIGFTYTNIKTSINNLEIDKGKAYLASANEYINLLKSNHSESTTSWTLWNEYYDAVANKDINWIKENAFSSAKEDSNSEVVITLNNNGSVLAEFNAPKEWGNLDFNNFDLFKKLNKDTYFASGIENTSSGVYITTIVKIAKSDDDKFQNTNGFTVYARKIKDSLLEKSKQIIGADVALKLDNGETLSTNKNLKLENVDSKSFNTDQVKTYTKITGNTMDIQAEQPFKDSSGNAIGVLHIEASSQSGVLSLNVLGRSSIILILILVLAVVLVCFLLLRTILRPLGLIVKEAQRIAEGNLSAENGAELKRYVSANDEIGQVTRAFESMKDSLSAMISGVKNSSTQVANLSGHMAKAAEASGMSSEQIATATHTLAEGANRQNNDVMIIKQQIEACVVKTEEGFKNTNQMLDTAKVSTDVAMTARKYMQEVIGEFSFVNKTVEFATESIRNLGKRSSEINSFMEAIAGISSQTNLLALNASIEAARAGENGKGFSIVAEEIRKLSASTAEATNKIIELISDIMAETSVTVRTMETNFEKINVQMDAIKKGGESLDTIVLNVQGTEKDALAIYEIYKQIQTMMETINQLANEISSVVNDNVAHSQEIAASSEEQSSSMEDITTNAAELASLAGKLHEEVIQFVTN